MFSSFWIVYNKGKSAIFKWIEKMDFPPDTIKDPSPCVKPINQFKKFEDLLANFLLAK